jgi:hypothetical protein
MEYVWRVINFRAVEFLSGKYYYSCGLCLGGFMSGVWIYLRVWGIPEGS